MLFHFVGICIDCLTVSTTLARIKHSNRFICFTCYHLHHTFCGISLKIWAAHGIVLSSTGSLTNTLWFSLLYLAKGVWSYTIVVFTRVFLCWKIRKIYFIRDWFLLRKKKSLKCGKSLVRIMEKRWKVVSKETSGTKFSFLIWLAKIDFCLSTASFMAKVRTDAKKRNREMIDNNCGGV